jgi:hypothetical protein
MSRARLVSLIKFDTLENGSGREDQMFRFVKLFSQGPPRSRETLKKEVLDRYEEIGRATAKRFVRGNVNIKAGRFLTKRDLAARKKEALSD